MTAIFGDNWIEVQDEKGHKSVRRSSQVKYVEPIEKVVQQLPIKQLLQNYGRSAKLLIAAKDIPNLEFNLEDTQNISKYKEHLKNSLEGAGKVVEVMESDVLSQTVREEVQGIVHRAAKSANIQVVQQIQHFNQQPQKR